MQKVSILIVTYNNLESATIPCLNSIITETNHLNYELIVVDNNSSDGTQQFLAELASREPCLKVVLNSENRGFSGGNNDALRIAQGDILVLLNNDTRVTDGWLNRISDVLNSDYSVGMVGPVTNSAGNEQNIFISGTSPEEIISEGILWTQNGVGDSFITDKLCFFCVAFRRDLLETVGMLDENFGLGFYEDDDYCLRVKNAGFLLKCLEDVFVYHHGSATFNSIPRQTKLLLKRNKALLEAKHGFTYSQAHPRDRQLELLATYLERLETIGFDEGLWYRLHRRMTLAKQLNPRGLFKRFYYYKKLRHVSRRIQALAKHWELS